MPRQLFKKTHRPRKVFTGTTALANPTTDGALLYIAPVFFKNVLQLMPSKESVKGEIHIPFVYYRIKAHAV